jgi:hypothetical protein
VTFDVFTQFKAMVEKQFDKSILCLHNDKGGEFIGIKWDAFFAQHGIRREHTVKASAQPNGVAECLNRTLEELLVAMLNSARLPAQLWGEGLNYLRHVIVRSPSSSIPPGTTPYEMVHKRKPDYSPLRVFGCRAWAHIQRKEQKSLQDHAKPCVFLGCPEDFKGWKPHARQRWTRRHHRLARRRMERGPVPLPVARRARRHPRALRPPR